MANFDQIGETGLDQVLAKRLVTPGGAVSPTVAPELFPGITLESDRPEWGFLKGEIPYGRGIGTAVPAGNQLVSLRNAAGSRMLVVVQNIQASVAAGLIALYLVPVGNLAAGASQGGCPPRDGRLSLISGGIHTRLSVSNVFSADTGVPAFAETLRSSGTTLSTEVPFIIPPGCELGIVARTAANALQVAIAFTERPGNPGEL